jgi:hypothetical protein
VKDKARKRMEMEMGCNIIKFPEEFFPGLYIAMKSPEDAPEPFFIAQVLQNFEQERKLKVHWYKPTAASLRRTKLYENMFYQEEMDNMRVKGNFNGKPNYKIIPWVQEFPYETIHFGFTKLKHTGGLPAEVLRQLKMLKLITGKIKRN